MFPAASWTGSPRVTEAVETRAPLMALPLWQQFKRLNKMYSIVHFRVFDILNPL